MPNTRPPHPAEFREDAVRLALTSGTRTSEIAAAQINALCDQGAVKRRAPRSPEGRFLRPGRGGRHRI